MQYIENITKLISTKPQIDWFIVLLFVTTVFVIIGCKFLLDIAIQVIVEKTLEENKITGFFQKVILVIFISLFLCGFGINGNEWNVFIVSLISLSIYVFSKASLLAEKIKNS